MSSNINKNKYTRLLSNTVLFGISTFASKLLTIILTPLYSTVLQAEGLGAVSLINSISNILIPIAGLGITSAVLRFGLEKGVSKTSVFTNGLTVTLLGGAVLMLLVMPFSSYIPGMDGLEIYIFGYVVVSNLRNLCSQFVRVKSYIRLYAIDGIMLSVYYVAFQVLFLVGMHLGPKGYILGIICSDALSTIGLLVIARMSNNVKLSKFNWPLLKEMLAYALPLVPNSIFWWMATSSNRFFIEANMGLQATGVYESATKLPSVITLLSTVFTEAWQLSAFTEEKGKERDQFFSRVYGALMQAAFLAGAAIIFGSRMLVPILTASQDSFAGAWKYTPFIALAMVFSCLSNFLVSIYMVEKKSNLSLATFVAGAVINVVLNAVLIPIWGLQGASVALFACYFVIFLLRVATTRPFIKMNYQLGSTGLNTMLLLAMTAVMLWSPPLWALWESLLILGLCAINLPALYKACKNMILPMLAAKRRNK